AGLGHEAVDDAVEGDVVVFAAAHQRLDLLDVPGRDVGPERDGHLAVLELEDQRVLRLGGKRGRAGEHAGGDDEGRGKPQKAHEGYSRFQALNLASSAAATLAGTKGRTLPPIAAIWRTSVAVMVRTEGLAGRNTV